MPEKRAASRLEPIAYRYRPNRVRVEHEAEHGREPNQHEERDRQLVRDVAAADVGERRREARAGVAPQHDVREPAVRGQRAERDGQGRQVEDADEEPVR
jgi:hypothetical protein